MTEKRIHCPACNSDNLDNSVYCCQCGSPMRRGIPAKLRKGQWILIIIISVILSLIILSGFQLFTSLKTKTNHLSAEKNRPTQLEPLQHTLQAGKESQPSFSSRILQDQLQPTTIGQIIVGTVSIMSRDGNIVAAIPAPIINGSWLALPARACIGGDKWFFKTDNDKSTGIEGGLWGRGDPVGLWRLAGKKKYPGPTFDDWRQDKPVVLLSIETGSLSDPITLSSSGTRGAFTYCPLPTPLEQGVFLQNGKVVGWSFGELLDGAFMWNRGPDPDLLYENYVDDFYNETFAGGREEYFSLALAMGDEASPEMQLQMFTEGFWFPPKLSTKDTPQYLRPETVYPYIIQLVNYMMGRNSFNTIATLAEEPLLVEVGSIEILTHVVRATHKSYGTETALNFIEGPGADIRQTIDGETSPLNKLHLELYLGWIKTLIDNGNIVKGQQIYNRARKYFGAAPELHLLAVELALANKDWAEAENLLYQKKYPHSLRETKMLLAKRVSNMKGRENKLILRFQPGSREIPVTATVNDKLDNDFLIDTGASFVTIPYSIVEALGLESEISPHQQKVHTAGGTITANFVILSSIELQGWQVSNVKALIVDLPNRPELGLLGLNFLNRFRLDLQVDEGILTLEPR